MPKLSLAAKMRLSPVTETENATGTPSAYAISITLEILANFQLTLLKENPFRLEI